MGSPKESLLHPGLTFGRLVLIEIQGQKLIAEILKEVPGKGYWCLLPGSCLESSPTIQIIGVYISPFRLKQQVVFPIFDDEILFVLDNESW